jgi:hypothetical protein
MTSRLCRFTFFAYFDINYSRSCKILDALSHDDSKKWDVFSIEIQVIEQKRAVHREMLIKPRRAKCINNVVTVS